MKDTTFETNLQSQQRKKLRLFETHVFVAQIQLVGFIVVSLSARVNRALSVLLMYLLVR